MRYFCLSTSSGLSYRYDKNEGAYKMVKTLTLLLHSGEQLILEQVHSVQVITDDAVINTTARNFFNIGAAEQYIITSSCGHTKLHRNDIASVVVN